jgi:hypothetical protein
MEGAYIILHYTQQGCFFQKGTCVFDHLNGDHPHLLGTDELMQKSSDCVFSSEAISSKG